MKCSSFIVKRCLVIRGKMSDETDKAKTAHRAARPRLITTLQARSIVTAESRIGLVVY